MHSRLEQRTACLPRRGRVCRMDDGIEPCNRGAKPVSKRPITSGQKMSLTFLVDRLYYKHNINMETKWLT